MAKKQKFDFDLIVIGSGAGGTAAATTAARQGKKVAIIESDEFGGQSPNWGDVPTKTLLHIAHLYDEAKTGAKFGIRSSTISYNFPSIKTWKDNVVKRAGGNRRHYQQEGINTYLGRGHFIGPNEISVNNRKLTSRFFLVATGADWKVPDIQGLDSVNYLTPRTILDAIRPPKSLYIIGGGSVAMEIAQIFATFGTKVYVAEIASRILPHEDESVGQFIQKEFEATKGMTILTQTRTLAVEKENIAKRVTYSRGGVEKTVRVDEVLLAASRDPELDLGLENAGVEYTPKGIRVNEYLQTSAKRIFASGDVLGRGNSFTHTALNEGRIAYHNMFHRNRITPNYTATPRITFTNPEIASVGLTENDCIKRDLRIKVGQAPLNTIARSNTSDYKTGFVKIIADRKGLILGATVVAPHAGEIIHELTLAIHHRMTAQQVAETPHAFLTWSEAIKIAATQLL